MYIKLWVSIGVLAGLSGCGVSQEVTLVNPTTKATAQCNAQGGGFAGRIIAASQLDDCIKKFEAQGYVRQDTEQ